MYNRPGKGVPRGEQRKKGGARMLELILRDGGHFLAANLLLCLSALPGVCGAAIALYGENPLAAVLAGGMGGLISAPFLVGLYDTLLRAMRDEAGYWWHTYCRAMRRNAKSSLLPGAVFGGITVAQVAALLAMLNQGGSAVSYALLFLGVLLASLVQVLFWPQLALLELPLAALVKNSVLLAFAYPKRTLPAALLSAAYWCVFLLLSPLSLVLMPILGFWYIQLISLMLVYPPMDQAFHIEQRIYEMKSPDTDSVMHDDVTSREDQQN